jgi:hypothetical protein
VAANGANNFGIRDNHTRGKVADYLVEKINAGSHLAVVSAYFTIYAYVVPCGGVGAGGTAPISSPFSSKISPFTVRPAPHAPPLTPPEEK